MTSQGIHSLFDLAERFFSNNQSDLFPNCCMRGIRHFYDDTSPVSHPLDVDMNAVGSTLPQFHPDSYAARASEEDDATLVVSKSSTNLSGPGAD